MPCWPKRSTTTCCRGRGSACTARSPTALAAQQVRGTEADLARHAREAMDLPLALAAGVRAGNEALRVGAPSEAMGQFESALELIDALPEAERNAQRPTLVLAAAEAAVLSGHSFRALNLIQDALDTLPTGTHRSDPADRHPGRTSTAAGASTRPRPAPTCSSRWPSTRFPWTRRWTSSRPRPRRCAWFRTSRRPAGRWRWPPTPAAPPRSDVTTTPFTGPERPRPWASSSN